MLEYELIIETKENFSDLIYVLIQDYIKLSEYSLKVSKKENIIIRFIACDNFKAINIYLNITSFLKEKLKYHEFAPNKIEISLAYSINNLDIMSSNYKLEKVYSVTKKKYFNNYIIG